ncbi:MAG: hypothetical protein FWE40_03820 [Oscillospiraceae bacterium]|nr:hypothetical protein [Oscillospiraceae bacterium]
MKKIIALVAVLALALALTACADIGINIGNNNPETEHNFSELYAQPMDPATFVIPPLDLRGYELDQYEVEQWFLERINYHRENYGIHPYEIYVPARITSIEHSIDMRDNDFSNNTASDGRTNQERHHRWFGYRRTKVTSAASSTHNVPAGPLCQSVVNVIVDRIYGWENTGAFLRNPTYYYIGVAFSIDEDGRGRLSITMSTPDGQRAAHHARTPDEREAHQQAYLERVREERGWVEP